MDFKVTKERLAKNFNRVSEEYKLFDVNIDKDTLWNIYIESFPEGTNRIYRQRRKYDCSCCRNFIQNIGSAVYIDADLNVHSIFEFYTGSSVFQPVMDKLDAYVKSCARHSITDVFVRDTKSIGTDKNRELLDNGEVKVWEHFYVQLRDQYVVRHDSLGTVRNQYRTRREVFKRSLDEISMDTIDTVLEMIQANSLYKGEEWKSLLAQFREFKKEYETIPVEKRGLYAWKRSVGAGDVLGKIRNHSIGVLLVDLSEGMDLETAVQRYEKIVAPTNYKRPKAIFTESMLKRAKEAISELGYMGSLKRRFATLDDITVNNILFCNRDAAKRIHDDVFDEMLADTSNRKFSRLEEIAAEKFVSDILPTAREVEVYLENKHAANMVSLIAPEDKEAPSMFKWDNAFGWAYSGNITDSDIRENVKNAGGAVDGVLRFSIQWNDGKEHSPNDLDAHCITPAKHRIYFGDKYDYYTRGQLDVDIQNPRPGQAAVENITWPNVFHMENGRYQFGVHQYMNRGGKDGFRAEIEFDGQIYRFDYNKEVRQGEMIPVADVVLDRDNKFTIEERLPSVVASREIWGLKTNNFVPVSVMMYSPNYWDDNSGIGHRHYFFMLKDCVNPEQPNGFYNEFLKHELDEHKRVLEALGSKMSVVSADDQLSGLGFSSTKRNDLIVKVKGATERVFKIKF